jgi:hypothetical protein
MRGYGGTLSKAVLNLSMSLNLGACDSRLRNKKLAACASLGPRRNLKVSAAHT